MFKKAKDILSAKSFFIFLLPLFFIYSAYNELFGFLNPGFVLLNLLGVALLALFIFIFIHIFLNQKKKSIIYTFFTLAYFLLIGFLHDTLKSLLPAGNLIVSFTFLIPLTILLLLLLFIYLKRQKQQNYSDLFLYLNVLMIALILSEIPNSIKRYRLDKSVHNLIDFRFNTAS